MRKTLIIISLSLVFALQIFSQTEKILVKSIDLNGNQIIAVYLSGKTTFHEWDKDFIRVTTRIGLVNSSASILDRLVIAGRYDIISSEKEGEMQLTMPKILKPINHKGVILEEKFHYEIFIPKNTTYRIDFPASEGL
jgi:hypothetical protein